MTHRTPRPLTAAEFFALKFEHGSMADAARGTEISYQTIHAHAKDGASIRIETADALQRWSLTVAAAIDDGVYISAARTVGFEEPTPADFKRAAAGR